LNFHTFCFTTWDASPYIRVFFASPQHVQLVGMGGLVVITAFTSVGLGSWRSKPSSTHHT